MLMLLMWTESQPTPTKRSINSCLACLCLSGLTRHKEKKSWENCTWHIYKVSNCSNKRSEIENELISKILNVLHKQIRLRVNSSFLKRGMQNKTAMAWISLTSGQTTTPASSNLCQSRRNQGGHDHRDCDCDCGDRCALLESDLLLTLVIHFGQVWASRLLASH